MDTKISDFTVASTATAATLLPVVADGVNKVLSVGILALNMPNLGNKGITKNAVILADATAIPLTGTLITLPLSVTPYTLANGSDGQKMTLVSLDVNTINITSGFSSTVSMTMGSTVTLTFIPSISKWVVNNSHGCVIT